MPAERFERLEGGGLPPGEVRKALGAIKRFENLEIGAAKPPPPVPAAPEAPAEPSPRHACLHCGQPNEAVRQVCWACFKPVREKAPPPAAKSEDLTLVLDGNTYRSGDPDIPEDVAVLMDRIRREGYSQELLAQWRSWRATRRSPPPPQRPFAPGPPSSQIETRGAQGERDIRVFRGSRVSVIRIDGKVYTSGDPDLPGEMKRLFTYIEANGVTPTLMEYLRQFGDRVKFRPTDTLEPSDGDLAFWKAARASAPAASFDERQAQLELQSARLRFSEARNRILGTVVAIAFFVLYFFFLSSRSIR